MVMEMDTVDILGTFNEFRARAAEKHWPTLEEDVRLSAALRAFLAQRPSEETFARELHGVPLTARMLYVLWTSPPTWNTEPR